MQDGVLEFVETFELYGLSDFTQYPGKITPSWKGVEESSSSFKFAYENSLWHYHIGVPQYVSVHPKYKTSDYVLHFQWLQGSSHIDLVDVSAHYKSTGAFYMPSNEYLKPTG